MGLGETCYVVKYLHTLNGNLDKDFHGTNQNGSQCFDLFDTSCQYFSMYLMREIFDSSFNLLRDLSKQTKILR